MRFFERAIADTPSCAERSIAVDFWSLLSQKMQGARFEGWSRCEVALDTTMQLWAIITPQQNLFWNSFCIDFSDCRGPNSQPHRPTSVRPHLGCVHHYSNIRQAQLKVYLVCTSKKIRSFQSASIDYDKRHFQPAANRLYPC